MLDTDKIDENYIFPQKNMNFLDISKHLDFNSNKITSVQKSSSSFGNCHLSFYPLAKNIRFISTHFFKSIKNNTNPIISDSCRPGEDSFWWQNTRDNWYPWIWTRYKSNSMSNTQSWQSIFNPFEISEFKQCDLNSSTDFYLYLTSLGKIFSISDEFKNSIKNILNTNIPDNICGLQIRRGEIVPPDGNLNNAWTKRPVHTIDVYMKGVEEICCVLGTKNVFVSTDSMETVEYLSSNYKEYNFYANNYDRNLFIRYDGKPDNVHLEIDLQSKPELIQHYTESCISDLIGLSMCKGYVGGMKYSEYGICGWFLQMFNQKGITPYVNVEGELELFNPQVGMTLL